MPGFSKAQKEKRKRRLGLWVLAVLTLLAVFAAGCTPEKGGAPEKLILGDATWDSIQVHNRVAGFILEHGYDYEVDYVFGETLPLLLGLSGGEIDIYMEVWTDNVGDNWKDEVDRGTIKDLGLAFPDAPQGWYVPTYMIEGDAARGIEAAAPDLQSVFDLPKYKDLFKDPEMPSKGRFHNSPPGWVCTAINEDKIEVYELGDAFNSFTTGSDTALAVSMVNAYEKGEPWVGYYWEPTWVMGKMDMTMLEEPAYDSEIWESSKGCHYPAARVHKGVHRDLEVNAPEVVEFIENYETTLQQNNDFLAYMIEHDGDTEKAALYFLEKYADIWKTWLPEDIAVKVEKALGEVQ